MKVIITIAKRVLENKVMVAGATDEIIVENVAWFEVNEGTQKIHCHLNDETKDTIDLYKSEGTHLEQWFLLDIKIFQIPMKVKI